MLSVRLGRLSVVTLLGVTLSGAATAQCVECATQMLNATIQSNTIYNTNMDRIKSERDAELRRTGRGPSATSNGRASGSTSILNQVEAAALAPLQSEFNRRAAADGAQSAKAWYTAASSDVGRQAGALMPEYKRRLAAGGQTSADAWYVANARELGRRYVQNGR